MLDLFAFLLVAFLGLVLLATLLMGVAFGLSHMVRWAFPEQTSRDWSLVPIVLRDVRHVFD